MKFKNIVLLLMIAISVVFSGCTLQANMPQQPVISQDEIPQYSGEPYVVLGIGVPDFEENELTTECYESYAKLDYLGRCGVAAACIGQEIMPDEERESIGQIKPSGWQISKYDFVDGKYLYNRCHLIGYQLTGENANEKNLITGTRCFNTEGMLPFENEVAEYVKETGNHVLYRVTPVFEGENLVASGVVMEAKSVEDDGEGVCFNVYVYNVQPGVEIDYLTGHNKPAGEIKEQDDGKINDYILNTNTKKFHALTCKNAKDIKPENRQKYSGTRKSVTDMGYQPCGGCNP